MPSTRYFCMYFFKLLILIGIKKCFCQEPYFVIFSDMKLLGDLESSFECLSEYFLKCGVEQDFKITSFCPFSTELDELQEFYLTVQWAR